MLQKKRWLFLILVLALGMVFSGCDLFNDIDLDEEEILEDLTIANFLNEIINDFGEVLQSFIDNSEYDDGLDELIFPEPGDLDFSALFAHIDHIRWWGEVEGEEEIEEDMLERFSYFLEELLFDEGVNIEDFEETVVLVNFQYKYFMEDIMLANDEYPQEELIFIWAMVIREISINGESKETFVNTYLDIAPYPDKYKTVYFYYRSLIENYGLR